ncbi:MAG: DegV family protein [Syntrophomonadaceae bacterium]|jgi:DegV family protein with EDD domain|nr:DegV family protein [Syntrophomonadaceae bacterium]
MAVKLVTDSTSYIDQATRDELGILVVNLSVHFPEVSYDETDIEYDEFYKKIERDNIIPTSSQPTIGQICEVFRKIVAGGDEVLGIFISAQMSGTYESALTARDIIREEYPDSRIEILDSKTNCMALGLQVVEAARAAQAGRTMEEVMEIANHIRHRVRFYFVPATLDYLIKGGRIGGAAALIGSVLRIRPILYVNNGVTDVFAKVRGTRKAVEKIFAQLHNDVKAYGLKHLLVHHINDEEHGRDIAARLSSFYNREVPLLSIGPVIGAHVGPGAVGVVYCTEQ